MSMLDHSLDSTNHEIDQKIKQQSVISLNSFDKILGKSWVIFRGFTKNMDRF